MSSRRLLLSTLLLSICLEKLNAAPDSSRCPHDIFSDVKGWREGDRCVTIWEEKLTSNYAALSELCSQRIPGATLPNVPPQSNIFRSNGIVLDPKHTVFLGASLTARFCASNVCTIVIEYSNKSGDSVLYNESSLAIYDSSRPGLQLPKNIRSIQLNYTGTDHFCITMSNETVKAVPCLKTAITVDSLICETDQLPHCIPTEVRKKYGSNCVCEKYYKGPYCDVVNEKDFQEAPEERPWYNNPVVTNSIILSLAVLVILYVVYRINRQRKRARAKVRSDPSDGKQNEGVKRSDESLFLSALIRSSTNKQPSPSLTPRGGKH